MYCIYICAIFMKTTFFFSLQAVILLGGQSDSILVEHTLVKRNKPIFMTKEEKPRVENVVGQSPGSSNSDTCVNLFLFHGLFTIRSFVRFYVWNRNEQAVLAQ